MSKPPEEVRAYYAGIDALSAISSDPWLDSWMPRRLSRRAGYALEKNVPATKPKLTWQETIAFLRKSGKYKLRALGQGDREK